MILPSWVRVRVRMSVWISVSGRVRVGMIGVRVSPLGKCQCQC